MRAIVIGLCVVLALGSPVMAEECRTPEEVSKVIQDKFGAEQDAVFKGPESEAIKHGIEKRDAITLDGGRDFLVFSIAASDKVLVVGFKDGCYDGHLYVTRHELDVWLANQGAQRP